MGGTKMVFSLWVVTDFYFLESFWVAMMMVSLPISTTPNLIQYFSQYGMFPPMWYDLYDS
jgi:hypothetical protein